MMDELIGEVEELHADLLALGDQLRALVDSPDPISPRLSSRGSLDALRGDPRFERLLELLERDTRRHTVAKTAGG